MTGTTRRIESTVPITSLVASPLQPATEWCAYNTPPEITGVKYLQINQLRGYISVEIGAKMADSVRGVARILIPLYPITSAP